MASNESITYSISATDATELNKLVSFLELSSGTTTIFAIAPESGPQHPVVEEIKLLLSHSDHTFQEPQNFFYSDNSLYNFLYSLDETGLHNSQTKRKLIMAFGIDQLPTSRLKQEMKQLNLGRDSLFGRELVIIFWLNKEEFLEEFRNRAPDFWDWRGKLVKFEARPPVNPLFYPYLEWLIAENSYLKISGVMQVQRQVDIFLDQIYVSLQAVRRQQITETSKLDQEMTTFRKAEHGFSMSISSPYDLDEPSYYEPVLLSSIPTTSTKTVTQRIDLSHAVRENQYCVILGAPGAGKTTLLRYLALHFATAKRDGNETVIGGEPQEELGKALLPIFFRIADYAERLQQEPELSLLEYLRQFYRQWEAYFQDEAEAGTEMATLLLEKMYQGQCLMLLDGLDEVFEQESRRLIVERIDQFVNAFSSNKFVITSRIAGYRDVKLSSRFAEFTIEDMGSEQVEKFLERWCLAIERAQQPEASEAQWQRAGDDQARKILEAIKDNEGVKRLTANPLLLTILALIHRNGERLPNRRVKLYELAVQTLTEDWQLGKKLPDAPKVLLNQNEVVAFLAPLAYWMHEEKPSGLVTEAEVEQQLAAKLAELNDTDLESDSVRLAVQEFLRKVRETTGLFVERAPGVYGFMHLTFEEYFAARYIADNEVSDILAIIRKHLHEPRWNEPILLALGYYGIYSPKQVNKLVEQLFSNLEAYEPAIPGAKLKIKNASSQDAIIIWSDLPKESSTNFIQSELRLKDLLFAGEVLTQVEVNSSRRKKLIQKLVMTYLGLDTDFDDDTTKQLLRLLRQIELFNQKCEVLVLLKEFANDSTLTEEIRVKAQTAILYVACGESGAELVSCVIDIVNQLEPNIFCSLRELVKELGEEMTSTLENSLENYGGDQDSQRALNLLTAISYIRTDKYTKAVELLEEINVQQDSSLSAYIAWSIATCYQEQDKFEQASDYYQECFEKLALYIHPSAFRLFWRNRGVCYRSHDKYEQSLECFQQALNIDRERHKSEDEASDLWNIGITYQEWGKYEEAIAYHQQSRDLYEQLGLEKNVANQWFWLSACYRDWGKYKQAVEFQQQCLAKRQNLENQSDVALTYRQLGRIYQLWSKYEQAIAYYHQSRDLYEQLGLEKNVADLWYLIANCYREWGKYEQALECQQKCLAQYKKLEDQPGIASAYFQLGWIHQSWAKYEQAIAYFQQSRGLYEQLGQDKNVASQWYNLAGCYREWCKYQQALECQQKCLAQYKKLEDQPGIASAYFQLGWIHQAWGKYEQAIAYHQQSRGLYEQLGQDKNVASQWYNLAGCYREWGKYQQALEYQQKCLAQRQKLEDQPGIASAYFQLGWIHQSWAKYEQAIAYFQQSRGLYEQLGQDKNVASQWYNLAGCYREWCKYQQALECQQKCLAQYKKLEDQPGIASAYFQLGWIHQAWGKYEQAIAYHQQSRGLYEQLGQDKNVASQWYNLAGCYREWGKYQQALEYQQKCLAQRQKLEDQPGIASAYFQLGSIHQDWGKYEQAIAYFQQSRGLYEQLGKDKNVASQWYNLANCYREWGKYEQALECQQKGLAQRQKLEDQPGIASAFFQLGRIYQAWGKYEQAITYFQQSCGLYEQLGQDKNVASQWYNLAGCYREWGKYQQALECQQKCLAQYKKLEDQPGIASAYFQLGWIHQSWAKYEQAIAYHQQSRDLYEQLGQDKNVANQWYWFGDCYREWSKYQQALECEQKELVIRQQLDDQPKIALAYSHLGRIYQAWGKYEQAIAYFQQSRDLYEQLGQDKNVASQWYNLAGCYREWGKYEQAIAYFQQSRDLYEQLGQDKNVASQWYNLAGCYREWAKYQQALECQQKCLAQRQKLEDQPGIASAFFQLGSIHQAWGKYEQAITYFQQSRDFYEQLGLEKNVANQWYNLAACYREWGKYKQALECQQKCLAQRQKLEDQPGIASAFFQLGSIHQAWGKYEQAIAYHQQSHDLYEQLGLEKNVANQLSWIASCYRNLKDYTKAIEYYQQSRNLYQHLGHDESAARCYMQLGNNQRLLPKNTSDRAVAFELLAQAEQNICQAIQINTTGDYKKNLAYDYIIFSLICSERLCLSSFNDSLPQEQIAQFEEYYNTGLTYLTELGQTVNRADEALDIARAYLEVSVLKNLDRAEELAQESLQVFQEYNRRELEASSRKLLGEIYLNRSQHHQSGTKVTATQFLTESLQIYRELDLSEKAAEVEQLMNPNLDDTGILSD
ncbi:tetratricopeptide repeat protein [Nostoc sp. ATCC 53789]|uniref:tetratricopeptide repeat protein n=1 Tax=Nostoc sp. ATCC 53789 TaxID=76335 RepID=UPI00132F0115|nr:tetratricopeptide repeat protein [Nostoc sp. ATCC 53789]QHG18266.1 tetratricopeptide repeat protein [Nostoc sp. ATCC 53789]